MPTPSSGTISISQIQAEFGRGNNLNAYRGTTWWTPQGASGTFSSGAISMSEFYNKQPNVPTFSFTISVDQSNVDLRALAVTAGWDQTVKVAATIANGVFVSSSSTGTPALTVAGSFPNGVELINNGVIIGRGGNAGSGGNANRVGNTDGVAYPGNPGSSGGVALSVSTAISITNNNIVSGGGGGGGGGGGAWVRLGRTGVPVGGGGGGGGIGNSSGGSGGIAFDGFSGADGSPGSGGSLTSNGSGGSGAFQTNGVNSATGGTGGAGGSYGSSGATGGTSSQNGTGGTTGGGSGGGAGACTAGNSNITWLVTGNRYGALN